MEKKAVVILSGGMDSSTCLAIARVHGFMAYTLSFDYGQRSQSELKAAEKISKLFEAKKHHLVKLDMAQWGGSALTDTHIDVPEVLPSDDIIPITYVPARNTIFLSYALALAEIVGANYIFIGANFVDYSNYPDCRPEYVDAFERMATLATKTGVEGKPIKIEAPLMYLHKADIIRKGIELGIDYRDTVSCYQADEEGRACAKCSSCQQRIKGFQQAGVPDQTWYRE